MDIKCPKCGKTGKIADVSIPEYGRTLNCPDCKQGFLITKQPVQQDKTPETVSSDSIIINKKALYTKIILACAATAVVVGCGFFLLNKGANENSGIRNPFKSVIKPPEYASNALIALKKMEAKCQVGISYNDYLNELGNLQFVINQFESSYSDALAKASNKPNGSVPELNIVIKMALQISEAFKHYQQAKKYWSYKFSGDEITREYGIEKKEVVGQILISRYPDFARWDGTKIEDSEQEIRDDIERSFPTVSPERKKQLFDTRKQLSDLAITLPSARIPITFIVSYMWKEASKEINNASKMIQ
ncbi:MAG: hypothetical protein Q7W05_05160 [Deltaproteobacteria bacterium]|nr:hypothetical protein [Deltaproteobacteria bacterium]